MGIFGAAKKGFGMLGKSMAKNRMLRGTSTRADRIKHGVRDKTIKSVPESKSIKKLGLKESIRRTKQDAYIKNIDEVTKHVEDIKKGKKAIRNLKHMRDTKRAFKIGKTKTFAHDPSVGPISKESKRHNP